MLCQSYVISQESCPIPPYAWSKDLSYKIFAWSFPYPDKQVMPSGRGYRIKNKAAIALQCKSNVKLIAALSLFRIIILFEELVDRHLFPSEYQSLQATCLVSTG